MAPLAAKQLRIGLRSLGTKIGIGRDGYWGGGTVLKDGITQALGLRGMNRGPWAWVRE